MVWFLFSKDILAKKNEGRAIKEIYIFRLAITDGQCSIVICGCGMNKLLTMTYKHCNGILGNFMTID